MVSQNFGGPSVSEIISPYSFDNLGKETEEHARSALALRRDRALKTPPGRQTGQVGETCSSAVTPEI